MEQAGTTKTGRTGVEERNAVFRGLDGQAGRGYLSETERRTMQGMGRMRAGNKKRADREAKPANNPRTKTDRNR